MIQLIQWKKWKKKTLSLIVVMTLIMTTLCATPFQAPLAAHALSSAEELTPFVYKKGSYTVLRQMTAYTAAGGNKSAGFTVKKDQTVSVTSVSDHFGKVTVSGKTGWMDLSYAYSTQNKVDISARLAMLRKKFPEGMYWNRVTAGVNNPDGYSDQPCPRGHTDHRDNTFDGTGQCHGFALKLGYDLFGIHAGVWQRHYNIDKVVPGDLIRYRSRHTVMVTGVFEDYFTVADCNYYYSCNILWDHAMSRYSFLFNESDSYDGIYHCPSNTDGLRPVQMTTALSP